VTIKSFIGLPDGDGDGSVNVDLPGEGRRVDDVGGHENDFELDAFVLVEAPMIGDLEGQVADMGLGYPDANLL
jgi:hypothetical protein